MQKKEISDAKKRTGRLRLIWFFLKGSVFFFVCCMISAAVSALMDMITPQIIRVTVDNVVGGESTESLSSLARVLVEKAGGTSYLKEHLLILAGAVMAVALIKVLAQYFFRVTNTKGSETMVKTMRDTLYRHIERLPFQWHMENHTGDIIQRCTSDIETARNFVSEQLTSLIRILVLLILSIVFMSGMNRKLTLIAMAPIPVILIYSLRFHNKIGTAFREVDENEGILSAMAQENLTGVRVVRAFGRENYERKRFSKHNKYYTGLWVNMGKIMARFWSTGDILSGVQILLIVIFGVKFCIEGSMTSGEYIAFLSYNSMLVWPIRQLGRMISEMSKAGVSIDRIGEIMDAEEEKDRENPITPDMTGDIRFEHVSFHYDGYPEMLHDIDFTIDSGTTLGILGGTGSGKSTLMYLLDRLYELKPESGRILIGGNDIADIELSHLRKNIGIVLQEPFLFSRSLKDNLSVTDDNMTEEEIREAAKAACLDETIDSFTKGYDTFVGERGVTLSGGQKQRAAIARMLTQNTPIMIFDDSLSAVDTETDAKIREALQKRFGSATIILISHRITTLNKADKVLVLDQGRISEFGSPEELKAGNGLYAKINSIQSMNEEDE